MFPLLLTLLGPTSADNPEPLGMSKAVLCAEVRGYHDYTPVAEPVLVRDEKLKLYYEPTRYKVSRTKTHATVHLTQDAKIRRRGEKAVLWSKADMVNYEVTVKHPDQPVYISNVISLKPLPPGDYDLELILRDKLAKDVEARQVVPFAVKASTAK